jgi:Tfp pilus assembly protein PilO
MTKELNLKQLAMAVAGIAVLLVAVWYLALIRPESHKLKSAHAAYAAAQGQISTLDTQVLQLDNYKRELGPDQQALATFEKEIPDGPELSAAIRDIQGAASTAQVSLTSLSPTVPVAGAVATTVGGATVLPVSMTVSGSYASLLTFTNELTSMTRTLVINTVSLSGSGSDLSDSLSADLFYAAGSSTSSN